MPCINMAFLLPQLQPDCILMAHKASWLMLRSQSES